VDQFIQFCRELRGGTGPHHGYVQELAWQLILEGHTIPEQMLAMICAAMAGKKG
jgi:hypothetical protein